MWETNSGASATKMFVPISEIEMNGAMSRRRSAPRASAQV
jgi:hypothetical protein